MSDYPPPTEFLTIFNGSLYDFSTTGLTIAEGDDRYLRLTGGIESGSVLFNAGLQSSSNITVASTFGITNSSNNKINFNAANLDFLINNISVFTITAAGPSYTNIDLATTGYLGNGGNEKVLFSSTSIDLQTEGTSKLLIDASNITSTLPIILPTTGNINNSSGESLTFTASTVQLKTSSTTRVTVSDTDINMNVATITLPNACSIHNGSTEALVFSATDVQLKTNNVTRMTIEDTLVTFQDKFGVSSTLYFDTYNSTTLGVYSNATIPLLLSDTGITLSSANSVLTSTFRGNAGAPRINLGTSTEGLYSTGAGDISFTMNSARVLSIADKLVSMQGSTSKFSLQFGSVIQTTSNITPVTSNTQTTLIRMFGTLAASTNYYFQFNNSLITTTSVITANAGQSINDLTYVATVMINNVNSGYCDLKVCNVTASASVNFTYVNVVVHN